MSRSMAMAAHQAGAAEALREAGLAAALAGHQVVAGDALVLPAGDPGRGPETSLINESALLAMIEQVGSRVSTAVTAGRFPVVYGGRLHHPAGHGSCAARGGSGGCAVRGWARGHDAAGRLRGWRGGQLRDRAAAGASPDCMMRGRLAERLPALGRGELAMLGQRDAEWRRKFNVASLRDAGVWIRDWRRGRRRTRGHGGPGGDAAAARPPAMVAARRPRRPGPRRVSRSGPTRR